MKKSFIFLIFLYQINCFFAFDRIDEFKDRLQAERIDFLSGDVCNIEFIKIAISTMYRLDQDFRGFCMYDKKEDQDRESFMLDMDQFHTETIKNFIFHNNNDWLIITRFGKETDHQAWLLVQHSSDLEFQEKCLQLLVQAIQVKETSLINYAYLYDRVALQLEKYGYKQRYGTQFYMTNNDEIILQPYEGSIEDINKNRLLIGLPSLQEYISVIKKVYKA